MKCGAKMDAGNSAPAASTASGASIVSGDSWTSDSAGRVMIVVIAVIVRLASCAAIAAVERHQELAPGIERGHASRDQRQDEGVGADAGVRQKAALMIASLE